MTYTCFAGRSLDFLDTAESWDVAGRNEEGWVPIPNMPGLRARHSMVHVRGRSYAVGGHDGSYPLSTVVSYDDRLDR